MLRSTVNRSALQRIFWLGCLLFVFNKSAGGLDAGPEKMKPRGAVV